MNGLAFYRLKHLPKEKSKKRKVYHAITKRENEIGVKYSCNNCGMEIIVDSNTILQCKSCDWRILEKKRVSTVVLQAV